MDERQIDINKIIKRLIDEKGNPKLPKDWTYLIHGTNTSQWNREILEGNSFTVKGNEAGLYCVEKENAISNQKSGSDVSKLHSKMKEQDREKDFEIRCLIYKDLRRQKDRKEFEGRLTQEEMDDVNNYHTKKPYYPAIPNNTKLIKLTTTEFDEITNSEKEILWYIPEKYLEHYLEECGVKTKDELEMSANTKKIDNLEVITEKVDEYTTEIRKLNGIEIASTKEFEDGSYDKKSRVFIAKKGINVSSDYINYTTFRSQYNSKTNTSIDTTQSPLIDDNGNVIGEMQYIETIDMQNGIREGHEYKVIEGEKGIFQIETTQRTQGDNYSEISTMNIDNKVSGNKEKIQYSNENGKETYVYMENGVIGQKVTKTDRGTTIDIYKDGQPYETFEYDEEGKSIIQMAGLEQLPDNYVKSQFDIVIPEHEVVSHELPDELYLDIVEQEQQNETIQQVSVSKLGKETLEEQKNVSQMDKVQSEMEEQLTQNKDKYQINEFGEIIRPKSDAEKSFRDEIEPQEKDDNCFRENLRVDLTTEERVEQLCQEFENELEEGKYAKEEQKKKYDHKVEKGDNDYIDRVW